MATKSKPRERLGISYKHQNDKINSDYILERISVAYNFPYDRMIVFGTSGFTPECYTLIRQYEPINVEIFELDNVKTWVSRIEVESDQQLLDYENIIKINSKFFIEKIAADPNFLQKVEWRELEKTIAEIFEGLAFKVVLTPPSKDGGKDLVLELTKNGSSTTYIVEIKHWRSEQKVGQKPVRDFLYVIINEKRERGLLLSTFGFTQNAFEGLTELERKKVILGDKTKIISLCKTYLRVKSGIWTPLQALQEILLEETY